MRVAVLSLIVFLSATPAMGQEKTRVDVDAPGEKTQPEATSGVRHGIFTPPRPRDLYWRVDFLQQPNGSAGNSTLEIHLVNVSTLTLPVPISQNGSKAVKDCPSHTVLELGIFIGKKEDHNYLFEVGEFFGCEETPPTVTYLKPGEWMSFIKKVPVDRLPNEMRIQMTLAQMRYVERTRGRTSEEIDSTFGFSPWQTAVRTTAKPQ